jgi:hypothetical protein
MAAVIPLPELMECEWPLCTLALAWLVRGGAHVRA